MRRFAPTGANSSLRSDRRSGQTGTRGRVLPEQAVESSGMRTPDHARYLLGPGRSAFSAVTIHVTECERAIVTNPAHATTRQMSSLCHELSHIALEHDAEAPLNISGGRQWNGMQEREADWLAGCLLIPQEAAHAAARDGHTDEAVARAFGVSYALAAWRMNSTGARIRARRLAKYR